MDEITDLLSEKRLAKYKGIGKENAIACHLFNCELADLFIPHYHILKSSCETRLIRYFQNIWEMTGFLKMSISSAEIGII